MRRDIWKKALILVGSIVFMSVSVTTVLAAVIGDVNGDGIVDYRDIRRIVVSLTSSLTMFDYNQTVSRYGTLALATPTPTPTPTGTPTPTPTTTPTPTPPPGNVKVLCDGRSFSNWGNKAPIEIGNNADDTNPNILKVIRNCNFVNPTGTGVDKPAILIQAGNNILIENSRFDNIRTLQANNGVHGIGITGSGLASNITIRGSYFNDIGADGIQTAYSGTKVQDIRIENNEFIGSEAVGENAIDIKSGGPYVISGNRIHGFRPCQSAKTNPPGNQDCSGSTGPAIVIHIGSVNVAPSGIVIDGNNIYDNTYGINVSGGNNILIKNNYIHNNIRAGITSSGGTVTLQNNTYSGNGTNCSGISPCQ